MSAALREQLVATLSPDAARALERITVVGASPLGMIDVRDASRARRADLVLDQRRRAGEEHVGRGRADDDQVDVGGREAGALDGLERAGG